MRHLKDLDINRYINDIPTRCDIYEFVSAFHKKCEGFIKCRSKQSGNVVGEAVLDFRIPSYCL